MSLKDEYLNELEKRRAAEEAERCPYDQAYAQLKALFHSIMDDREFRQSLHAEVELNGDELQIDPGPILMRATVDKAGRYHFTYEIKHHEDPVIKEVPVKTIPDIEQAVARLLVEYGQ